ncbi:MAG TPA: anti-sigma factor antagonist [Caldithrix abyssi]|uniref:Anti-sigma factor antagonist n=1 Tax=Caldithrix abyssi TaxID=187145 RepID=A0A7V4U375_CALAY|nr:anti-sigma factor antagonist [Caldithrix abyssi]
MEFKQKSHRNGSVLEIEIPERLTTETSDELKQLLKEIVNSQKYKIVLNLGKNRYMDSSGLGAIVSKISVLRSNNGDIRLAAVHDSIRELLELTHLNQIIHSYPTVEEAVNSFEE